MEGDRILRVSLAVTALLVMAALAIDVGKPATLSFSFASVSSSSALATPAERALEARHRQADLTSLYRFARLANDPRTNVILLQVRV